MMIPRHVPVMCSILLGMLVIISAPAAASGARYDVVLDDRQSVMTVKACFEGTVPERLVNQSRGAVGLLKKAYVVIDGQPRALVFRNGEILTADLRGQDCLHYQVDFLRVMQMMRDLRYQPEQKNHVRTRAGDWLWLPAGYRTLELAFHLEEGYQVSTPWHRLDAADGGIRYRLEPGDDNEQSLVYFGRFPEHVLNINDSRLYISCMSAVDSADMQKLVDWIEYGARALALAYGEFPLPQLSVLVFPLGMHSSVVPWGEVKRDGGPSIHLYVDQTRPLREIIEDWTLVHELSHTLHPYLRMEGRWLTEGLATYYQNLLQARAGTLSTRQAWNKLHQGFRRGRDQTEAGLPLQQVSKHMRENRKFMRVYWSGTALWLQADLHLRTRHGTSLDHILGQFRVCCLLPNRTWTSREYMQTMDRLSGTQIFTQLYDRYAMSDEFPDLGDVYAALGLRERGDELAFDGNARQKALIEVIMSAHALP